jgi:hypothetical protein
MPDDAIPLPGAPTIKALESFSELLGWQTPTDPVQFGQRSAGSPVQTSSARRSGLDGRVRLRTVAVRPVFHRVEPRRHRQFGNRAAAGVAARLRHPTFPITSDIRW